MVSTNQKYNSKPEIVEIDDTESFVLSKLRLYWNIFINLLRVLSLAWNSLEMNLAIETSRYILQFGQLLPVHPHNMVSLISNWFILSPTERSPNSCSVIAAQPTSKFHPPHPIFIQVDYMYKYIQTPLTSSLIQVNYIYYLQPPSSSHPIFIQVHCL